MIQCSEKGSDQDKMQSRALNAGDNLCADSMKDFFEDLGKRLSETAEAVTAKAGDAIEVQKLKAQIRELARGNAEDLMELGQSIYDRFENGEELDEASKGLCEAIASRKESMEEYENKIEGLKGACECTRCDKMVAKDMAFCPYCGSPVTEEEDILKRMIWLRK